MTNKLADELKRLRKIKNASLRDVELETKISNAYLSQLERGDAANPSPQKLFALAEYYSVPYESLLQWAGHIVPSSGTARKPSEIEAALMSAELTEDELNDVADYIEFIRSKRKT